MADAVQHLRKKQGFPPGCYKGCNTVAGMIHESPTKWWLEWRCLWLCENAWKQKIERYTLHLHACTQIYLLSTQKMIVFMSKEYVSPLLTPPPRLPITSISHQVWYWVQIQPAARLGTITVDLPCCWVPAGSFAASSPQGKRTVGGGFKVDVRPM